MFPSYGLRKSDQEPTLGTASRVGHPTTRCRNSVLVYNNADMRREEPSKDIQNGLPRALTKKFLKRFPIIGFPSRCQVFPIALGKTGVVKDNLGSGALLRELEFRNRVHTRIPVSDSPGLDDSLVRDKFDMSPHDIAAEARERASHFSADFRRRRPERHPGLHGATELRHLVELFGVGKGFINTFPTRFEHGFLMNGFLRARN